MKRVLIIGPGSTTRGGITTVINSYKDSYLWEKWNCKWIGTYSNINTLSKVIYFIIGWMTFIVRLPFCQLVHIHFTFGVSAFRKCFFFYPAKLLGKNILLHLHSPSLEEYLAELKIKSYKRLFLGADGIIVLSNSWKNLILNIIPKANITVLYNAYPTVFSKNNIIAKNKSILYLGILNDRKGYLDLIHAFSRISHLIPEWQLEFGGNGEIEKAQKLVEELNIGNKVKFYGWVTGEKKKYLLSHSSIFCLPSKAEGFPMSVLEAFSYGLPVITTPVGGLKDDLKDNEDVLFVTPGNVEQLSNLLLSLTCNKEFQQKLSERSIYLALNRFSYNTMINNIDKLYSEIISK